MPIGPENLGRHPADWKARSRFVRVYRSRDRCEWCGAENGLPHAVTGSWVVLTAAHFYDHRPEATSLLNLAALCHRSFGKVPPANLLMENAYQGRL